MLKEPSVLLNVLDYGGSLEVALAVANDGDRIYLPARSPYVAPSQGWVIRKSLEILGDGPGISDFPGTILVAGSENGNVFTIDAYQTAAELPPNGRNVIYNLSIHDLRIAGTTSQSGTSGRHGIEFVGGIPNTHPVEEASKLSQFSLERVVVSRMGGDGLHLAGLNGVESAVVQLSMTDCEVSDCAGVGIFLQQAYVVALIKVRFLRNGAQGLQTFLGGAIALYGCRFTGNEASLSTSNGAFWARTPGALRLDSCNFEDFGTGNSPRIACHMQDAPGAIVGGCSFTLPVGVTGGEGLRISGGVPPLSGSVVILPNRFVNVPMPIAVPQGAATPCCVILPQFCDPATTLLALPSGSNDAPLAIPSVNGTSSHQMRGLLVPSLAVDPEAFLQPGMLVHVDGQLHVNIGGGWNKVDVV